jgi:predicted phage terminase large subunit-like protein
MGLSTSTLSERTSKAVQDSHNSLHAFLRNFWHVLNEDPFTDAPHIKFLCDVLEDYAKAIIARKPIEDLVINVPPGSSKSTIVSQMFPAWLWLHAPWAVVIGSSYAYELTVDHAVKSKRIIDSERFQHWFQSIIAKRHGKPLSFIKETEKNMVNNYGGARISTSTGGTITGKHGHVIIEDDPMKPMEAASDAYRKRANDFSDRTLSSRKKDKRLTPRILVMQRLHEDDTTGARIAKGGKIRHICLPAEISDRVSPKEARKLYSKGLLDPVRMPMEVLEEEKVTLGSYGYAGQFDQAPAPEGGGLIKTDWFPRFESIPRGPVRFFVDTAYTSKQENDETAILAYVVHQGDIYIIHSAGVRKEFPELCEWLPTYVEAAGYTGHSQIWVEPKASGLSVVQQLKKTTNLNIVAAPAPDSDKVTRINAVSPIIQAGRVKVLDTNAGWINAFFGQCEAFPNGAHDDRVDTLEGAIRCDLVNAEAGIIRKRS